MRSIGVDCCVCDEQKNVPHTDDDKTPAKQPKCGILLISGDDFIDYKHANEELQIKLHDVRVGEKEEAANKVLHKEQHDKKIPQSGVL